MEINLNISKTALSVKRMFNFATAANKKEATDIGPIDTFMDGVKSMLRLEQLMGAN